MKQTLLFLLSLALAVPAAFAVGYINSNGNARTDGVLSGTFSNPAGASFPLEWTLELSTYGDVIFVLKENGTDARLSGLQTLTSTYEVTIATVYGVFPAYTAKVTQNGKIYNALRFTMGEEFDYLPDLGELDITITGNGYTYRLGTVDPAPAWDVLYPVPEGSVGFVFYDKGEYSDGWRYLEAAPADLKLVNGVPTVDEKTPGYDGAEDEFVFGYYRKSPDGKNLFINGTDLYNYVDCTEKEVGSGLPNTKLLVLAMGNAAYEKASGDKTTDLYAAKLCEDLVYTDPEGNVIDDWFLPSREELNLIYTNLYKRNKGNFQDNYYDDYWSSTEYVMFPNTAWYQYFSDGDTYDGSRDYYFRVRPVRAF